MTRDEILSKLQENGDAIRSFGVLRLGIFGSYARGEQQKASDMDFLVEFEDATLQRYLDLKEFLEQLFHCPVDLVFMDTLKPRLKPIILNEVVYAEGYCDCSLEHIIQTTAYDPRNDDQGPLK